MAADGLCTGNGIIHGLSVRKIARMSDGRIVGCSGTLFGVPAFLQWLEYGGDMPSIHEDFEALVLLPTAVCLSYNHKGQCIEQEVPAVTGSGGAIALGAMLAGASPREAVAIACQRDTATGGEITEISL